MGGGTTPYLSPAQTTQTRQSDLLRGRLRDKQPTILHKKRPKFFSSLFLFYNDAFYDNIDRQINSVKLRYKNYY